MQALIENKLVFPEPSLIVDFMSILNVIYQAKDYFDLKEQMQILKPMLENRFEYGFDSSHMWVRQIIDGNVSNKRLIFVDFKC